MRKRYSRSYTILSFLTMFSYRELPSGGCFLLTLYKYSRFYLARSAWMSFFSASTPRRTAELVSSVIF